MTTGCCVEPARRSNYILRSPELFTGAANVLLIRTNLVNNVVSAIIFTVQPVESTTVYI